MIRKRDKMLIDIKAYFNLTEKQQQKYMCKIDSIISRQNKDNFKNSESIIYGVRNFWWLQKNESINGKKIFYIVKILFLLYMLSSLFSKQNIWDHLCSQKIELPTQNWLHKIE